MGITVSKKKGRYSPNDEDPTAIRTSDSVLRSYATTPEGAAYSSAVSLGGASEGDYSSFDFSGSSTKLDKKQAKKDKKRREKEEKNQRKEDKKREKERKKKGLSSSDDVTYQDITGLERPAQPGGQATGQRSPQTRAAVSQQPSAARDTSHDMEDKKREKERKKKGLSSSDDVTYIDITGLKRPAQPGGQATGQRSPQTRAAVSEQSSAARGTSNDMAEAAALANTPHHAGYSDDMDSDEEPQKFPPPPPYNDPGGFADQYNRGADTVHLNSQSRHGVNVRRYDIDPDEITAVLQIITITEQVSVSLDQHSEYTHRELDMIRETQRTRPNLPMRASLDEQEALARTYHQSQQDQGPVQAIGHTVNDSAYHMDGSETPPPVYVSLVSEEEHMALARTLSTDLDADSFKEEDIKPHQPQWPTAQEGFGEAEYEDVFAARNFEQLQQELAIDNDELIALLKTPIVNRVSQAHEEATSVLEPPQRGVEMEVTTGAFVAIQWPNEYEGQIQEEQSNLFEVRSVAHPPLELCIDNDELIALLQTPRYKPAQLSRTQSNSILEPPQDFQTTESKLNKSTGFSASEERLAMDVLHNQPDLVPVINIDIEQTEELPAPTISIPPPQTEVNVPHVVSPPAEASHTIEVNQTVENKQLPSYEQWQTQQLDRNLRLKAKYAIHLAEEQEEQQRKHQQEPTAKKRLYKKRESSEPQEKTTSKPTRKAEEEKHASIISSNDIVIDATRNEAKGNVTVSVKQEANPIDLNSSSEQPKQGTAKERRRSYVATRVSQYEAEIGPGAVQRRKPASRPESDDNSNRLSDLIMEPLDIVSSDQSSISLGEKPSEPSSQHQAEQIDYVYSKADNKSESEDSAVEVVIVRGRTDSDVGRKRNPMIRQKATQIVIDTNHRDEDDIDIPVHISHTGADMSKSIDVTRHSRDPTRKGFQNRRAKSLPEQREFVLDISWTDEEKKEWEKVESIQSACSVSDVRRRPVSVEAKRDVPSDKDSSPEYSKYMLRHIVHTAIHGDDEAVHISNQAPSDPSSHIQGMPVLRKKIVGYYDNTADSYIQSSYPEDKAQFDPIKSRDSISKDAVRRDSSSSQKAKPDLVRRNSQTNNNVYFVGKKSKARRKSDEFGRKQNRPVKLNIDAAELLALKAALLLNQWENEIPSEKAKSVEAPNKQIVTGTEAPVQIKQHDVSVTQPSSVERPKAMFQLTREIKIDPAEMQALKMLMVYKYLHKPVKITEMDKNTGKQREGSINKQQPIENEIQETYLYTPSPPKTIQETGNTGVSPVVRSHRLDIYSVDPEELLALRNTPFTRKISSTPKEARMVAEQAPKQQVEYPHSIHPTTKTVPPPKKIETGYSQQELDALKRSANKPDMPMKPVVVKTQMNTEIEKSPVLANETAQSKSTYQPKSVRYYKISLPTLQKSVKGILKKRKLNFDKDEILALSLTPRTIAESLIVSENIEENHKPSNKAIELEMKVPVTSTPKHGFEPNKAELDSPRYQYSPVRPEVEIERSQGAIIIRSTPPRLASESGGEDLSDAELRSLAITSSRKGWNDQGKRHSLTYSDDGSVKFSPSPRQSIDSSQTLLNVELKALGKTHPSRKQNSQEITIEINKNKPEPPAKKVELGTLPERNKGGPSYVSETTISLQAPDRGSKLIASEAPSQSNFPESSVFIPTHLPFDPSELKALELTPVVRRAMAEPDIVVKPVAPPRRYKHTSGEFTSPTSESKPVRISNSGPPVYNAELEALKRTQITTNGYPSPTGGDIENIHEANIKVDFQDPPFTFQSTPKKPKRLECDSAELKAMYFLYPYIQNEKTRTEIKHQIEPVVIVPKLTGASISVEIPQSSTPAPRASFQERLAANSLRLSGVSMNELQSLHHSQAPVKRPVEVERIVMERPAKVNQVSLVTTVPSSTEVRDQGRFAREICIDPSEMVAVMVLMKYRVNTQDAKEKAINIQHDVEIKPEQKTPTHVSKKHLSTDSHAELEALYRTSASKGPTIPAPVVVDQTRLVNKQPMQTYLDRLGYMKALTYDVAELKALSFLYPYMRKAKINTNHADRTTLEIGLDMQPPVLKTMEKHVPPSTQAKRISVEISKPERKPKEVDNVSMGSQVSNAELEALYRTSIGKTAHVDTKPEQDVVQQNETQSSYLSAGSGTKTLPCDLAELKALTFLYPYMQKKRMEDRTSTISAESFIPVPKPDSPVRKTKQPKQASEVVPTDSNVFSADMLQHQLAANSMLVSGVSIDELQSLRHTPIHAKVFSAQYNQDPFIEDVQLRQVYMERHQPVMRTSVDLSEMTALTMLVKHQINVQDPMGMEMSKGKESKIPIPTKRKSKRIPESDLAQIHVEPVNIRQSKVSINERQPVLDSDIDIAELAAIGKVQYPSNMQPNILNTEVYEQGPQNIPAPPAYQTPSYQFSMPSNVYTNEVDQAELLALLRTPLVVHVGEPEQIQRVDELNVSEDRHRFMDTEFEALRRTGHPTTVSTHTSPQTHVDVAPEYTYHLTKRESGVPIASYEYTTAELQALQATYGSHNPNEARTTPSSYQEPSMESTGRMYYSSAQQEPIERTTVGSDPPGMPDQNMFDFGVVPYDQASKLDFDRNELNALQALAIITQRPEAHHPDTDEDSASRSLETTLQPVYGNTALPVFNEEIIAMLRAHSYEVERQIALANAPPKKQKETKQEKDQVPVMTEAPPPCTEELAAQQAYIRYTNQRLDIDDQNQGHARAAPSEAHHQQQLSASPEQHEMAVDVPAYMLQGIEAADYNPYEQVQMHSQADLEALHRARAYEQGNASDFESQASLASTSDPKKKSKSKSKSTGDGEPKKKKSFFSFFKKKPEDQEEARRKAEKKAQEKAEKERKKREKKEQKEAKKKNKKKKTKDSSDSTLSPSNRTSMAVSQASLYTTDAATEDEDDDDISNDEGELQAIKALGVRTSPVGAEEEEENLSGTNTNNHAASTAIHPNVFTSAESLGSVGYEDKRPKSGHSFIDKARDLFVRKRGDDPESTNEEPFATPYIGATTRRGGIADVGLNNRSTAQVEDGPNEDALLDTLLAQRVRPAVELQYIRNIGHDGNRSTAAGVEDEEFSSSFEELSPDEGDYTLVHELPEDFKLQNQMHIKRDEVVSFTSEVDYDEQSCSEGEIDGGGSISMREVNQTFDNIQCERDNKHQTEVFSVCQTELLALELTYGSRTLKTFTKISQDKAKEEPLMEKTYPTESNTKSTVLTIDKVELKALSKILSRTQTEISDNDTEEYENSNHDSTETEAVPQQPEPGSSHLLCDIDEMVALMLTPLTSITPVSFGSSSQVSEIHTKCEKQATSGHDKSRLSCDLIEMTALMHSPKKSLTHNYFDISSQVVLKHKLYEGQDSPVQTKELLALQHTPVINSEISRDQRSVSLTSTLTTSQSLPQLIRSLEDIHTDGTASPRPYNIQSREDLIKYSFIKSPSTDSKRSSRKSRSSVGDVLRRGSSKLKRTLQGLGKREGSNRSLETSSEYRDPNTNDMHKRLGMLEQTAMPDATNASYDESLHSESQSASNQRNSAFVATAKRPIVRLEVRRDELAALKSYAAYRDFTNNDLELKKIHDKEGRVPNQEPDYLLAGSINISQPTGKMLLVDNDELQALFRLVPNFDSVHQVNDATYPHSTSVDYSYQTQHIGRVQSPNDSTAVIRRKKLVYQVDGGELVALRQSSGYSLQRSVYFPSDVQDECSGSMYGGSSVKTPQTAHAESTSRFDGISNRVTFESGDYSQVVEDEELLAHLIKRAQQAAAMVTVPEGAVATDGGGAQPELPTREQANSGWSVEDEPFYTETYATRGQQGGISQTTRPISESVSDAEVTPLAPARLSKRRALKKTEPEAPAVPPKDTTEEQARHTGEDSPASEVTPIAPPRRSKSRKEAAPESPPLPPKGASVAERHSIPPSPRPTPPPTDKPLGRLPLRYKRQYPEFFGLTRDQLDEYDGDSELSDSEMEAGLFEHVASMVAMPTSSLCELRPSSEVRLRGDLNTLREISGLEPLNKTVPLSEIQNDSLRLTHSPQGKEHEDSRKRSRDRRRHDSRDSYSKGVESSGTASRTESRAARSDSESHRRERHERKRRERHEKRQEREREKNASLVRSSSEDEAKRGSKESKRRHSRGKSGDRPSETMSEAASHISENIIVCPRDSTPKARASSDEKENRELTSPEVKQSHSERSKSDRHHSSRDRKVSKSKDSKSRSHKSDEKDEERVNADVKKRSSSPKPDKQADGSRHRSSQSSLDSDATLTRDTSVINVDNAEIESLKATPHHPKRNSKHQHKDRDSKHKHHRSSKDSKDKPKEKRESKSSSEKQSKHTYPDTESVASESHTIETSPKRQTQGRRACSASRPKSSKPHTRERSGSRERKSAVSKEREPRKERREERSGSRKHETRGERSRKEHKSSLKRTSSLSSLDRAKMGRNMRGLARRRPSSATGQRAKVFSQQLAAQHAEVRRSEEIRLAAQVLINDALRHPDPQIRRLMAARCQRHRGPSHRHSRGRDDGAESDVSLPHLSEASSIRTEPVRASSSVSGQSALDALYVDGSLSGFSPRSAASASYVPESLRGRSYDLPRGDTQRRHARAHADAATKSSYERQQLLQAMKREMAYMKV